MSPNDPRHGTYAGAAAHWKAGERCCDPCRAAATRRRKGVAWDARNGRPRTLPTIGAVRRIQALQRLGWSLPAIAAHSGIDRRVLEAVGTRHTAIRRTTHEAIAAVYEELSMRLPPQTTTSERISATRARRRAERNGWAPPLAWDDIDDPDEQPTGHLVTALPRTATRADTLADLFDRGAGISEACRVLGVSREALERWCARHGHRDLYAALTAREWRGSSNQHAERSA